MKIKNIRTLTKSEIAGYFVSPAAYVFIIIFLVLSGFFTFSPKPFGNFFKAGDASLLAFFYWHPWLYLILVPAIGMHMWSDEKRLGTNELLFTLPVTVFECIISKFIAAWLVIAIALIFTFPMVITVCHLGNPDGWAIACGYLGSFLLAGTYLAIASFTSSFTKSQVVSFISCFIICLFLIFAGYPHITDMLVEWAPRKLLDTVASFSVWPYFQGMQRGVIDSRDIFYFFSLIVFGLFLTHISLKNRKGTIISSITGAIVVGLIIIFFNALTGAVNYRWDLTEKSIYTLSDASRKILAKIDKPVTIKFYCSYSNNRMPIYLKNFAGRIEDLLTEYREAGKGNIFIEKFDPKQFSDAEDSAIMDGISGQPVAVGEKIYLGLAISCGKKNTALPFIVPVRENLLEYDITSAIAEVFRSEKPTLGIMSSLPVAGGPPSPAMMDKGIFTARHPWLFVNQLKKNFDIRKVNMATAQIEDDLDLLIVFHPSGISADAQFAIDQYILKGGKVIVFVDPWSFVTKNLSKADPSLKGMMSSDLPVLFKAWGVKYNPSMAVADAIFGRRIRKQGQEANFLSVLDITAKGCNSNDVITSELDNIAMYFPGTLEGTAVDGLKRETLIHTTKDSCTMSALIVDNPHISFRKFSADDKIYDLGIRLMGKFRTAFPKGKPSEKAGKGTYLKESIKESAVVIICDVDFLFDEFCVQIHNEAGKQIIMRINDNLNLAQNIADTLGGDSDMIGIRCRPTIQRPFNRVKKIKARAEEKLKAKILELEQELKATEQRLNMLRKQKTSKKQQIMYSHEQEEEVKKFRALEIKIRKDLKQLLKEYRREIDSLEVLLMWLNILLLPGIIALFGIIFGIIRKIRGGAH